MTGFGTGRVVREAFKKLGVFDVILKQDFDLKEFRSLGTEAINLAMYKMELEIKKNRVFALSDLLLVHESNLNELEQRKAKHGMNVPLEIENSIKHEQEEIRKKREELRKLLEEIPGKQVE